MALPGLGIDEDPVAEEEQSAVTHDLSAHTEWRFEISFSERVKLRLLTGSAELFGTELAPQHTYTFTGVKAALHTHHGCTFSTLGNLASEYIAEETPMTQYLNLHFALDSIRRPTSHASPPKVLILGSPNAGKTSLAKLLCAYALRSGYTPVAVNLDPKEGQLSLPGTMSAVTLESILDIESGTSGWGSAPTNGPSAGIPVKLPLVYYLGRDEMDADNESYKALVTRVALGVTGRMQEDEERRRAGCIIDAPSSLGSGKGIAVVDQVIQDFGVNTIVVLGSERMYNDINRRFGSRQTADRDGIITVVKLDKSGGCVDRDASYMSQVRHAQVREYFFGDTRTALSPHTTLVDFSDVTIFRVTDENSQGSSLLPGGDIAFSSSKDQIFERITEPPAELQSSLLAIMNAEPTDSQADVRASSVVGFVHVAEVDDKRRKLKLLAPLSGRLPRRVLLWGLWPEQMELDA